MPLDADALAWITLSRAPKLSAARLAPLLTAPNCPSSTGHFASAAALASHAAGTAPRAPYTPAQLVRAADPELARAGLPAESCAFLRSAAAAPTAAEIRWLEHPAHWMVGFCADEFPKLLREIPDCPLALYVGGRREVLRDPQIAIVGSRNPTAGGRTHAFEFARDLARCGLTVTSGLAEGIDAAAHRGALLAEAPTLAVLGTGIDVMFPRAHADLSEQIAVSGALVSEFPLGTPGRGANFPQRNRIIAALSLGTLVVEATLHSGSLITARFAAGFGRETFAIPGSIRNPLARGCHALIRDGAVLAESSDDILRELNFSGVFAGLSAASGGCGHIAAEFAPMDKDREILLDALGFEPTTFDELVARSGFKADAVSSMMLILELEGRVLRAPAGRYARVARSS